MRRARAWHRRKLGASLAVGLLLLSSVSSSVVQAGMTPTGQARRVFRHFDDYVSLCVPLPPIIVSECETVYYLPSESEQIAPDFGYFDGAAGPFVLQQSSISSSGVEASGSSLTATSYSSYYDPETFEYYVSHEHEQSENLLSVSFDLSEPTDYLLTGEVRALGAVFVAAATARITLTGPGGVIAEVTHSQPGPFFPPLPPPTLLNESGTLAAGSYLLEAELLGGSAGHVNGNGDYSDASQLYFELSLVLEQTVPALNTWAIGGLMFLLALAGARGVTTLRS